MSEEFLYSQEIPVVSKGKVFLLIVIYAKFFCTIKLPQFAITNESGVSSLASYLFERENIINTDVCFQFPSNKSAFDENCYS